MSELCVVTCQSESGIDLVGAGLWAKGSLVGCPHRVFGRGLLRGNIYMMGRLHQAGVLWGRLTLMAF